MAKYHSLVPFYVFGSLRQLKKEKSKGAETDMATIMGGGESTPPPKSNPWIFTMTSFSEANAKFALDFYHVLSNKNPFENILFSPVNLTVALGLLLLGSESDTAAQLESALRSEDVRPGPRAVPCECSTDSRPKPKPACPDRKVPNYECDKPEGLHAAFHKILAELNKLGMDYDLDLANRLYADYNIVFIQKFLYCALKLYLTEVDGADIQHAPEEVLKLINLWVEVQTHGRIKDLLPKDSFDSHAHLLLVNALYFKGQWEMQFDKAFTQEGVFYLNDRDSTTVQFMYQNGQYNIGTVEECEVQVCEIPYRNKELSLFVLLPQDDSVQSLQQLEDELTAEKLLDWSHILKPQEVEVVIPKFRVEQSIDVNTYLDLSNVTDPKKADLSATTTTKDIALTQLVHDTVIEVDEEGGEKACNCSKKKHVWDTLQLVADHPFIYYVLHKSTKSIVIFGRFSKPESREA
ncbi:hypothetical protein lerEdw1_006656 [Lerista edwardsae]|nr:hypothetical protein lerEdw1_006656 [Lerista edwardsae]